MKKLSQIFRRLLRPERMTSAAGTALLIGVLVAVNAVVYALSSIYGLYLYKADEMDFTLSDGPAAVFAEAADSGDEVTILFCQPEADVKNNAAGRYVYETAIRMQEAFPSLIKLDFENIIIHPDSVQKYIDEDAGVYVTPGSVIFIHGDNYRVLTTANAQAYAEFFTLDASGAVVAYNGEEVMTSMVLWVLTDEHPHAYFTVGHSETADITLVSLLSCAGYYVETINLRTQEVPTDAGLVVISNPLQDFERSASSSARSELDRLESYMERGGNVLVMADPYMVSKLHVLSDFVGGYGITFATTAQDGKTLPHLVHDGVQSVSTDGMKIIADFGTGEAASEIAAHIRGGSDRRIMLPWTGALQLDAERAQPLLKASDSATLSAGGDVIDREGGYVVAAYGERAHGDVRSGVTVIPSVYLAVSEAMVSNGYANRDFVFALAQMFGAEQTMPYGCKTIPLTNTALEGLTLGTARVLTAVLVAVPTAIAVCGAVVVLRRKYR